MTKTKVVTLLAIALGLAFFFGFEVSSNKDKITYDLYKFTDGNIDWVEKPIVGPSDRITEDKIFVLKDKIEINVDGAEWSSYEPTGSMEPILSERANGLYLIPKGPEDIHVGDIIAYHYSTEDMDIVHRVVGIQKDKYGNYFYITKGDANPVPDPELVPYDNVKRILFGVIY